MKKPLYAISQALFFCLVTFSFCFCEEPLIYDKIVVTSHRKTSFKDSLEENYGLQVLDSSGVAPMAADTPADTLERIAGLDLRYRCPSGIQGDLSLRGSTFEQVGVLVDGVSVRDPQTGHYNLDLPLTRFDVERIEAFKEGASSLYGSGALAGSINFITRQPTQRAFNLESVFGEHGLFGNAFSLTVPSKTLSGRLSFEHRVAKAARPNTDFEYKTGSLYLVRPFEGSKLDALVGYQKKDFGADSFYSNLFPEEEEHTETFLFRGGFQRESGLGLWKNVAYLRKHDDKFILNRNAPVFVNYHTTYAYGMGSALDFPTEKADFLLGADTGREQIHSTNLGRHARQAYSLSLGLIPRLSGGWTADMRARTEYCQGRGIQESYNLGLGYFMIARKLKINGSIGQAYRIPSFTELYYADAANQGNPDLAIEKSRNFRMGLNFEDRKTSLALDGFLRQGSDLIDWTRLTKQEAWIATNLGRVDFRGVEFICSLAPELKTRGAELK